jgi:hypothetical protein
MVQNKYEVCGLHICVWLSHKKSYCTDQIKIFNGLRTKYKPSHEQKEQVLLLSRSDLRDKLSVLA